jgi:Protein of unknown function (DUF3426)
VEAGIKRPVAIAIGLAVVAVIGVVLAWSLAPRATPHVPPGLTEVTDAAELPKLMELTHLNILTSTNYLGHRIYTVRATLRNISNLPIRLVDVKLTFRDTQKPPQVIQQENHPAFEPKQSPLEPGTEYTFDIPFENPPRAWNYHVPDTEIVRVGY